MSNTITITPTLINDPFPPVSYSDTGAFGINDAGTIVVTGVYGQYPSYEYDDGSYTSIPTAGLGSSNFVAYGINDDGVIVGDIGNTVGIIDTNRQFQTISAFGDRTQLFAMNDSGEAVGSYEPSTNINAGFIYDQGMITKLNDPLSSENQTEPNGINDSGEIVGDYISANGTSHGFTYLNGVFTTVDYPGAADSGLVGISNNGMIVGYYGDGNFDQHGFIDVNGSFTSVNLAGNNGADTVFDDINDSGQIVGFEVNADYQSEAFTANIPTSLLLPPTIANPITLSSGVYPSPFTITSSQTISATTNNAVYSDASAPFLQNDGDIISDDVYGGNDYGVDFAAGGTVDNALITSNITANFAAIQFAFPGTVINSGTLSSGDVGIVLHSGGHVTNYGTGSAILGGQLGIGSDLYPNIPVTIDNQGTISGGSGDGLKIGGGATITDSGTISGSQDAILFLGTTADRLVLDPTAVLIGNIAFSTAANSTLELATGAGTLAGLGPTISNLQTLAFDPGAAWTLTGTADGFAKLQTISGFTGTDTLDITGFIGTISAFSDLTGLTLANGTTSETLALTSLESFGTLTAKPDGSGGTVITEVTCFCAGTRILTDQGEISVETLKIGDRVHTLHAGLQPIKWIGTRTFAAPFCNHPKILPIRIAAHAIAENIPARDLFVSPGHAIALDDALIHAARLVNGTTITQLSHADRVEYFHIELETHEVIFAENTPTETFLGEHFRNQFQNAQDFAARYPGATAPETHCLPPLDRGFHLAAILRRLNARAGITPPAAPGPLAGFIDSITPTRIIGWAADRAAPNEPVILDILSGAKNIGRTIANIPRPDVAAAGFGAGHHGFEFDIPPNTPGPITIRRTADAAPLPHAHAAIAA